MKRNYLFIVATLFVVGMSFVLVKTHALERQTKKPDYAPRRVEKLLPPLPHLG